MALFKKADACLKKSRRTVSFWKVEALVVCRSIWGIHVVNPTKAFLNGLLWGVLDCENSIITDRILLFRLTHLTWKISGAVDFWNILERLSPLLLICLYTYLFVWFFGCLVFWFFSCLIVWLIFYLFIWLFIYLK